MANILYAKPRISDLWLLGFEEFVSNKLGKPNANWTMVLSDTDVISHHDDNAHVGEFCPLGGAVSAKIFPRPSILDNMNIIFCTKRRRKTMISGYGYW